MSVVLLEEQVHQEFLRGLALHFQLKVIRNIKQILKRCAKTLILRDIDINSVNIRHSYKLCNSTVTLLKEEIKNIKIMLTIEQIPRLQRVINN